MRSADGTLTIRHAVALGLLQGPSELLPISSSGHTTLLPWLVGWPYAELDGELRKSFEVALHAGAGLALAIEMRSELRAQAADITRARVALLALSVTPPAVAGFLLRGPIERHLGGPRSVAAGLALGAVAMALADRDTGGRTRTDVTEGDSLALGFAQASALIPGVSRNGATLTAARARGFDRQAAHTLSWEVALPVLLAASTLKGARLARGIPAPMRGPLAAGAASAFFSTALSGSILRRRKSAPGALLPYAIYRCLLAATVMAKLRCGERRG